MVGVLIFAPTPSTRWPGGHHQRRAPQRRRHLAGPGAAIVNVAVVWVFLAAYLAASDRTKARLTRAAEKEAGTIEAMSVQAKDETAAGGQDMKNKWQSHVADLHGKAADKKAEIDARKAGLKAESAEHYADDAVSFAIAAGQEAEYAVLDVVLARSDADSLAGTS